MNNNLEKYGIKIFNNAKIEDIINNPPSSNFVIFNFGDRNKDLCDKILNNEFNIEKLPYRLFVVKEKEEIKDNKRICPLEKNEFESFMINLENKEDPRESVLFLYCKWLKHLINLNNFNYNNYNIGIYKAADTSDTIIPAEVFAKYEWFKDLSKINESDKDIAKINSGCEGLNITVNEISKENYNENDIIYHRHHVLSDLIKGLMYYEGFCADSVSFPIYFWRPGEEIERQLRACLLLENSLLSVVIADERICKNSSFTDKDKQIKNRLFLLNSFKGDNSVDFEREDPMPFFLDCENSSLDNKNYSFKLKCAENNSEFNLLQPAILIVHQGVLDKAFTDKSKENLQEVVTAMKNTFQYIIVTSGRGKPDNVPENAKFILLSDMMINFRCNAYPDKLGIINLIMSLTK